MILFLPWMLRQIYEWALDLGNEEAVKERALSTGGEFCLAYYFVIESKGKEVKCPIFMIWQLRLREFAWYFQDSYFNSKFTELFPTAPYPGSTTSIRCHMCLAGFYDSDMGLCTNINLPLVTSQSQKLTFFYVIPQRWDLLREIIFLFRVNIPAFLAEPKEMLFSKSK